MGPGSPSGKQRDAYAPLAPSEYNSALESQPFEPAMRQTQRVRGSSHFQHPSLGGGVCLAEIPEVVLADEVRDRLLHGAQIQAAVQHDEVLVLPGRRAKPAGDGGARGAFTHQATP